MSMACVRDDRCFTVMGKERVNGDICLPFYCGACCLFYESNPYFFMLQLFLSSKSILFQYTEKEENYKL
jgi:hypothetical protein